MEDVNEVVKWLEQNYDLIDEPSFDYTESTVRPCESAVSFDSSANSENGDLLFLSDENSAVFVSVMLTARKDIDCK